MTAKSDGYQDREMEKSAGGAPVTLLARLNSVLAGCWSDVLAVLPVIPGSNRPPLTQSCLRHSWKPNLDTGAGRDVLTGIWGERKQFHSTTGSEKPQSVSDSFKNWPLFGEHFLIKWRILGETSNKLNHSKWPWLWPSELRCKEL